MNENNKRDWKGIVKFLISLKNDTCTLYSFCVRARKLQLFLTKAISSSTKVSVKAEAAFIKLCVKFRQFSLVMEKAM